MAEIIADGGEILTLSYVNNLFVQLDAIDAWVFVFWSKSVSAKRGTNIFNIVVFQLLAVGFKVNNERAVQFRKWANTIVKDYTIKGWVMDGERLKNGGTVLTEKYFEEQLEKIREIRLSERRFYQKITDLYATAMDYDKTAKTTKGFLRRCSTKCTLPSMATPPQKTALS